MSISSEISRISGNVSDSLAAVAAKGVTVPTGSNSDDLAELIAQISSGGTGAISIVDTADSGGGTVRTITAVDISGDTVAAGSMLNGVTAHDASGNQVTGNIATKTSSDLTANTLTVTAPAGYYASAASKTLTDENLIASNIKNNVEIFGVLGSFTGGGGGLTYESGTYTPASDVAQPTISFANSHTTPPFSILFIDNEQTVASANSGIYWVLSDWYHGIGKYVCSTSNTTYRYARINYAYKTSNSMSESGSTLSTLTGGTSSCLDYYVSETGFKPYTGSTSRYWRSNRTYEWIAVWAPTT